MTMLEVSGRLENSNVTEEVYTHAKSHVFSLPRLPFIDGNISN